MGACMQNCFHLRTGLSVGSGEAEVIYVIHEECLYNCMPNCEYATTAVPGTLPCVPACVQNCMNLTLGGSRLSGESGESGLEIPYPFQELGIVHMTCEVGCSMQGCQSATDSEMDFCMASCAYNCIDLILGESGG